MSGGSYDYAYQRVTEFADKLGNSECMKGKERDPRRLAFVAHLRLVAQAMQDIEWVDSCDYGPGEDRRAIDAVLGATVSDYKRTGIPCFGSVMAAGCARYSGWIEVTEIAGIKRVSVAVPPTAGDDKHDATPARVVYLDPASVKEIQPCSEMEAREAVKMSRPRLYLGGS